MHTILWYVPLLVLLVQLTNEENQIIEQMKLENRFYL